MFFLLKKDAGTYRYTYVWSPNYRYTHISHVRISNGRKFDLMTIITTIIQHIGMGQPRISVKTFTRFNIYETPLSRGN